MTGPNPTQYNKVVKYKTKSQKMKLFTICMKTIKSVVFIKKCRNLYIIRDGGEGGEGGGAVRDNNEAMRPLSAGSPHHSTKS